MSSVTPVPKKLKRILQDVRQLRPMPSNVTRILQALENPNTSATRVADLISMDQAITASILKMANSPMMGFTANCTSIVDGVVRIGFKQTRMLVIGASSENSLKERLSGYQMGEGDLWRHAVSCASIALWFARTLRFRNPDEAYVGGLLHDLGKLVLDQYVLADYRRIGTMIEQHAVSMSVVERKFYGIDHARVGGLMAEEWNFPESLASAIQYHHNPGQASQFGELAALVDVSNSLCPTNHFVSKSRASKEVHPTSLEILKLTSERVQEMTLEMKDSMKVMNL
jgi:putative nucleotidyltransferase with HDIG domain